MIDSRDNKMPIWAALLMLALAFVANPQNILCTEDSTIRIFHWDLNASQAKGAERREAIRSVLSYIQPDIVIFQGWTNPQEVDSLAMDLSYALGSDSVLFAFVLTGRAAILFDLETLRPGALSISDDDPLDQMGMVFQTQDWGNLFVMVGNWVDESIDDPQRQHLFAAESLLLMAQAAETLDSCVGRIVLFGRLNAKSPADAGLRRLSTGTHVSEAIVDISQARSAWDDEVSFSSIHTNSTDSTAGGGLLRRTTMASLSESLLNHVKSWRVVGNDAMHFGRSPAEGANNSEPRYIIDALVKVSKTLPIVVDIDLDATMSVNTDVPTPKLDLL